MVDLHYVAEDNNVFVDVNASLSAVNVVVVVGVIDALCIWKIVLVAVFPAALCTMLITSAKTNGDLNALGLLRTEAANLTLH